MIRPTTIDDVRQLEPTKWFDDAWRVEMSKPQAQGYLEAYCRTLLCDKEMMGIAGVAPLLPGTGELWMALQSNAQDHPVLMARSIVHLIGLAQWVLHAHRLQCTVPADPEMERYKGFLTRCGFECEGTLRSYYEPGQDYWLFARLFDPEPMQ